MFVVVFKAIPTPQAPEFATEIGAFVTVFTCMITEEDALEVAHSRIEDEGWQVTSLVNIAWVSDELRRDYPAINAMYHQAVNEGSFCEYDFFERPNEAGQVN